MQKTTLTSLCCFRRQFCRNVLRAVFPVVAALSLNVAKAQTAYTLGTSAVVVGPSAGSNSVVLAVSPATGVWTATSDATWLHFSLANEAGLGSTNVIFSYDANPGPTRCGTLTISGQTLTITQAGSAYVPAGTLTTLGSAKEEPLGAIGGFFGVAVDNAGDVYGDFTYVYKDVMPNTVVSGLQEWAPTNNAAAVLIAGGLNSPEGLAVDGAGNVYVADGNTIIEFNRATPGNITTLVPSGLNSPGGVALDAAGNVYIADTGDSAIKEWKVSNSNLVSLVSSGLKNPQGVALDVAGNVYIADTGNSAIQEWKAANSNLTVLLSGLNQPADVTVDGEGNVYIADTGNKAVKEWIAASNIVTGLFSSSVVSPEGVAVDGLGNVYIASEAHNVYVTTIEELPYAFVDPSPKSEGALGGYDTLPPVLSAAENLLAPFDPASDEDWLILEGVTNGVVSFFCEPNYFSARTAQITLLDQTISVTQAALVIGSAPILTGPQVLGNGAFQFTFTNTPGASFTVVATTNLSIPLADWLVAGYPVENPSGTYQFTSQPTATNCQIFYSVLSP
jgi:sugar lactone lactonase YvrE